MSKTNAINIFTTIPISATQNGRSELEILPCNDKNIQCNFLEVPYYIQLNGFSIENTNKRKCLIRAIFGWIILQNFVNLPVMYYFLQYLPLITTNLIIKILWALDLTISALLYCFRKYRRPLRSAYVTLLFAIITNAILMGVYANVMNSLSVIFQPIVLVTMLSSIILYSLQSTFKLTTFRAILIVLMIYSGFIISDIFIADLPDLIVTSSFSLIIAVYIIIDTQLMLTSPLHNYQMTESEHVFGAVNLYADQSKLAWLLFDTFFVESSVLVIRTTYKILVSKVY